MMNHCTMNKTVKIIDTVIICQVQWTPLTIDEDRLRIICLARKMPGYMIKKVYTWLSFIVQLNLYLLCTIQMQFMLYSLQV